MDPRSFLIVALLSFAAGGVISWGATSKYKDSVWKDAVSDQKIKAEAILAEKSAKNVALMVERDALKTKLEKEDAANRKTTDDLRARYATRSLQFVSSQRCGPSGGGTGSAAADSSGNDAATIIQLPDEIARNLRQLANDADKLADDYKKCFNYANSVK